MSPNPNQSHIAVHLGSVEFFVKPGHNNPKDALDWLERYSRVQLALLDSYAKQHQDGGIEFGPEDLAAIFEPVFMVAFACS